VGQTPILHFSGKFRFHMPRYNNSPRKQGEAFKPQDPKPQVMRLCGCNPAHYFDFEFLDVVATQVTYRDGTQAVTGDAVLGAHVRLVGLLPDVSPSAICALLFAGRLQLGGVLGGKVSTAIQSHLRLSIRPLPWGGESTAAHFDARVTVRQRQDLDGSRFAAELEIGDLDLHFQLNRYTEVPLSAPAEGEVQPPEADWLTGDVYGYLRPAAPTPGQGALRLSNRRVVAHPRLRGSGEVERTYLLNTADPAITFNTDIEGSYDLLVDEELLTLRYLDFVPFLDRKHTTPQMDHYDVYFEGPDGRVEVGRFVGDHKAMKQTGGLVVLPLPSGTADRDDLRLAVDVVRAGVFAQPLMLEPELDFVLESPRALFLASGGEAEVTARVYRNNRPLAGHRFQALIPRPGPNSRSPVVARFGPLSPATDSDGRAIVKVQALDLRNTGDLLDPVTGQTLDALPFDRYYGNFLYLQIDQPLRRTTPPVERLEVAIRVVHRITPEDIPEVPRFDHIVSRLFAYYLRYYPWLHTIETDSGYKQFLDLSNFGSVSSQATTILDRLERDIHDPDRMPRSRDFPAGGVELFKRWIDAGMQL
jgi:hypothetical protein